MIKSWMFDKVALSLFREDESLGGDWQSWAAPAERERAQKMGSQARARTFLQSRAFLRRQLAAILQIEPAAIEIELTPEGKPFIANGPAFSISHSKDLILIGVLPGGKSLGVDIQYIDPETDISKLAQRMFMAEDRARIESTPPAGRRAAAFQTWCLREARYKMGEGINPVREETALLEKDFAYAVCYI